MLLYQNKVFVCNWSEYFIKAPNNTIQVIDAVTDRLIDSVKVGKEPNSMVFDKYNRLWVLSSGGYNNEEYPELNCLNPNTLQIEKKLTFPSKIQSPSSLCINKTGDTLYYINQHIYCMSVDDNTLPANPFILRKQRLFYSIAFSPDKNNLWVSDAIDYTQNGFVYWYSTEGDVIDSVRTGIIPGYFCFTR
jgi:YVTN family beta-propeller protein